MAKKKEKVVADELISTYKVRTVKEKVEVRSPLPEGMVRCIALVTYTGMSDLIFKGDVFDVPERRFKSLALRGYVDEYSGDEQPNGKR